VEQAVAEEARRLNRAGYPAPLATWRLQLRFVAEAADARGDQAASKLLNELGNHLRMVADLVAARAAFERAFVIGEAAIGPDHPYVARYVSNLGNVLQDLGDLAGARAAFERALAINEKAHGSDHPDHPSIQTVRNNLATLGGPGSS
jgi:tetratricopeptide (TPR) repeat protein